MRILAINPGSTSTKFAVYDDEQLVYKQTIRHSGEELSAFPNIPAQYDFRKQLILKALEEQNIPVRFDAIVGRGGLLKPMEGGVFEVNEAMKRDIKNATRQHACNLGGLIAAELAEGIGCKAYIVDAAVTDELEDVARFTGLPFMKKITMFHALNQKAVAHKHAKSINKRYEDLNLVVAHLGGGISVGAHKKGRVIDVNNALDGNGPFSPERSGSLPVGELVNLCFSGKYTQAEITKMINGKGGLMAYFGSNDVQHLIEDLQDKDPAIKPVLDAMMYNVGKEVAAMCAVLHGEVDAILLTGGIAYNTCMDYLIEQIKFLAPIFVYPGEDELEALALGGLRVLRKEETLKVYA